MVRLAYKQAGNIASKMCTTIWGLAKLIELPGYYEGKVQRERCIIEFFSQNMEIMVGFLDYRN